MSLLTRVARASHILDAQSPLRTSSRILNATAYRTFACSAPFARTYSSTAAGVRLTAPNGRSWTQPTGLFIGNEFVPSSNGQTLTTINPTTEEPICSVSSATPTDVSTAVRSARTALKSPSWARLSGTDRGALLHALAALALQHAPTLATIEALDGGKPYLTALSSDVARFAEVLRYYAGFADKNPGQTIDVGPDKMAYTVMEPVGVCGLIVPWNYPLEMAAWKLGPALACGNTVVLKPSELTPLSALYLGTLVTEAGFPAGVVNILNGTGAEAGRALVEHGGVDKIAFTGSTETGREVMRAAAGTLKNVTLETGGKSPMIVFADADVKKAARWAHLGVMSNSGQVCTANSRLLVHRDVMDEFVAELARLVDEVSVLGDPFDEATFQGPQVSAAQRDRILGYIESGLVEGARLVFGGKAAAGVGRGYFVDPTLFAGVTRDMRIWREEIFGPCAVVAPFGSEEEALELANDSVYGLGAMVFTRDLARAHRVARGVEAGMVFVNSCDDSDVRTPFGGVKQSGVGRELGEAGLAGYCSVKTVHVNLGEE
ncbi:probable aldehyde dehydrogenase [Cephalotrichum gorgonifer]|uniref:aldehyde dehydrogenase (NAD(+)) n=1 Tax=Cephalotrichum gorgonifer TaxID=2041049 RepID=A0AAE8MV25_9PEZI|nr:probable aldehyde dehydrogenase [Cephalotrichum gorgonifer]